MEMQWEREGLRKLGTQIGEWGRGKESTNILCCQITGNNCRSGWHEFQQQDRQLLYPGVKVVMWVVMGSHLVVTWVVTQSSWVVMWVVTL
eukprot:scaffold8449_cov23-Cyclotella_meneghiniana.AAC.3